MKASNAVFSLASILFLIEPFICVSQTNFGVSFGIDCAKIRETPNQVFFQIVEPGYGSRSLFGGLRVEQKVNKSVFLSLQGSYTEKKIDAGDIGFIPFKRLEFKEIKVAVAANWIPFSTFSIGGGPSLDFIPSINKIRKNGSKEEIEEGRREIGGLFNASYLYEGFLLEVNYYNGFKVIRASSEGTIIEPIKSFGISLSYIITVFDKRKGKKSGHPRMRRI